MFAPGMTVVRRQQYRHRGRGAGYTLATAVMSLVAVGAARSGEDALTVFALLLFGVALAWAARHSMRLAERWRLGADSERAVQHALKGLADSGWVMRNGVRWPGGGDIDHLVRSPAGVGFAIETKTRTFSEKHLRRTAATARWAARRRRRYPAGVVPMLCVVRARRVESRCGDVVVVSLDRLVAVLERTAFSASRSEPPVGQGCGNRRIRSMDWVDVNRLQARVTGRNDG